MASHRPDRPEHKLTINRARPTASVVQPSSATGAPSPHTPVGQRSLSSIYGSPSSSYRSDDDTVVLEIGARYLRAGFAGESSPRCILNFGPDEQRRVGDYRQWDPEYSRKRRKRKKGQEWGQEHELWRMDLRDLDLGLVTDKLERAVREVQHKHVMLDGRQKRVVLAMPPTMPKPLLSCVLNTLFTGFAPHPMGITLVSTPVLAAVAAGLRSALVVDIGWAETTVTALYEYREVLQRRSVRAGRMLSEEMGKMLTREAAKMVGRPEPHGADEVSFDEAEEALTRVGWCFSREQARQHQSAQDFPAGTNDALDTSMSIPLPAADPPSTLQIPFKRLAEPAETALFASSTLRTDLDDHDQPIGLLTYTALLSLPLDVRAVCMSRILITGGVSNLPGIKRRIIQEVSALVAERGWDPVKSYGSALRNPQAILRERDRNRQSDTGPLPAQSPGEESSGAPAADTPSLPPAFRPPERDPIAEKLHELNTKGQKPPSLASCVALRH
ncbi:hypothetical protein H2199_004100 [Coniosporium tulheliwenetii]|uniref:Uncharacterized protein n=1 Tax=Coniosporium tulheliwenetii TaxID=3383036 RepID=A0ACC2Z6S5_9PEZI|nr:hypothetical protein H2199_004100 [Cladosporium sp. JES 115]